MGFAFGIVVGIIVGVVWKDKITKFVSDLISKVI